MESYRHAADEEARALKDSYLALDRLYGLYGGFDDRERALANEVLNEWALSEDENLRFDALALIDEFKISEAIAALKTLALRLAASEAPGAPFELQKVDRLVAELGGQPSSGYS
jgi:hypothetical protein